MTTADRRSDAGCHGERQSVSQDGTCQGTPDPDPRASAAREKLLSLDPRYRYSAAVYHATGMAPWDKEAPRLYDITRALSGRPEEAIAMAVSHVSMAPNGAALRAGRAEAVVAALDGIEHDKLEGVAGLAEYARQLRAALKARERGLQAQDAELAAAVRGLAGRVADDGRGSIGGHLAKAAAALDDGYRGIAWLSLDMARRHAAGEFGRDGLMAPLDDGTAAHEQVTALMERLVPVSPVAGGTFADLLHAGDVDATAADVVTRDVSSFGPEDPAALAVQGRLRDAARALRAGDRSGASDLLAAACELATAAGTTIKYGPPGPPVERHLARIGARASGEPQKACSYIEQAAAVALRLRAADPDGPPPLARAAWIDYGHITAVDDTGHVFDVTMSRHAEGPKQEVTVTWEGRSLTSFAR